MAVQENLKPNYVTIKRLVEGAPRLYQISQLADPGAVRALGDDGTGNMDWQTVSPADADYLVKTANPGLSAERVVTDTTSITWDWATAGQAKAKRAALTGDVTASADSNSTTIANDAVTYAKMQNVSAASKLLGRGSASGAGNVEEITLGTNLSMSGTTINASGAVSDGDKGDITVSGSGATWTVDSDVIASGTYTPTLTNEQLITSSTAYQCQYLRVRSVVTVSGQVDIEPSGISGLAVRLGISLPIASNILNEQNLGGTGAQVGSPVAARIHGDATNDRARLTFNSSTTATGTWSFSFTYLIQ